jgi:DNA-binding XRE family transcriptional regulator
MQPTHASDEAPQLVLNRKKLNELRRAHSIDSEAELARRIGVAASTLWRISEAKVQPSPEFIARVMVAFPTARMDDLFSVSRPVAVAS